MHFEEWEDDPTEFYSSEEEYDNGWDEEFAQAWAEDNGMESGLDDEEW